MESKKIENNYIEEQKKFNEFARKVNEMTHEKANALKKNGHTCIKYLQTMPQQLSWCNQEPCKYTKK